jgi:hypothetical protein
MFFFCIAPGLAEKICFERHPNIYIVENGKESRVTEGHNPALSADGSMLAFTQNVKGSIDRTIQLMDLRTGKLLKSPSLPGRSCYEACFSPDGQHLAFHAFDRRQNSNHRDWGPVIYNVQTQQWTDITPVSCSNGLYLCSWTSDSLSILAHDLKTLYRIDLCGHILESWPIKSFMTMKDHSASSATRFHLHNDKLIYDMSNAYEDSRYRSSLYAFDLKTQCSQKLTPDNLNTQDFTVYKNEIFFSGAFIDQERPDIYKMSLDDPKPVLIISRGDSPSVSP